MNLVNKIEDLGGILGKGERGRVQRGQGGKGRGGVQDVQF